MKTRAELESMLDQLQSELPQLVRANDDEQFWIAFNTLADSIRGAAAGAADQTFVKSRIDCMLSSEGLIPGDNEGQPCA